MLATARAAMFRRLRVVVMIGSGTHIGQRGRCLNQGVVIKDVLRSGVKKRMGLKGELLIYV